MTFTPALLARSDLSLAGQTWFAVGKAGLLVCIVEPGGPSRYRLPGEADLASLGVPLSESEHLGRLNDTAALAVRVPDTVDLPAGFTMLGLRGLVEAFDDEVFAVAGQAGHVLDWLETSRFCGRCGGRTERLRAQRCMLCPTCALHAYPRIAPAVIVLVRRGDEALLARNSSFRAPFYSTLAGFSDIGETLEATVRREILEEVGLSVDNLRYFGSQPWPFPNSLMIAFTAEWAGGDIHVDADEIAEAAWFSATELPLVPPRVSIARRMIDAWVEEVTTRRSSGR